MYRLDIISRRPDTMGKRLVPYAVGNDPTVGAFGDEPYAIRFINHSPQRVEVRLSIDGTDLLTGKPATTELVGKKWVVDGHGSVELKAWPESSRGGAAFVFTSGDRTVAAHTHGVVSDLGIIAAAVFVEGYTPPPRLPLRASFDDEGAHAQTMSFRGGREHATRGGGPQGSSAGHEGSLGGLDSVMRSVGTGAGAYEEQTIQTVAGLRQPRFSEVLRVRYLWWDDLCAQFGAAGVPREVVMARGPVGKVPGFPGNVGVDLGSTPRPAAPAPPADYARTAAY